VLVAHEPPLAELLPDAERWRAFFQDVGTAYATQGAGPAIGRSTYPSLLKKHRLKFS
jgi:hypothetical protein